MSQTPQIISGALPRPFGKYVLTRELGRGAMGIVFEAKDSALDRRVALKLMLPSDTTDPKESELEESLFTREARLLATLEKHPNIVSVYEFGTIDARRYIAMEYIDGIPLSDWNSQRKPSFRSRIRILRDVALAVDHAHQSGILHRDLKPKNVLVDPAGRAYVTDFGMAKRVGPDSSVSSSSSGTVVGTPSYMSPEQAQGLKKIDRRTDVYALGAMLYEILTGKPPFPGEMTIVALLRVVQDVIPTPTAASPEWAAAPSPENKAIEAICMRALSKNPADRYPSAIEFAQQLTTWLGDKPAAAPAKPASARPRKSAVIIAVVALLLAALGIVAVLMHPPEGSDWKKAEEILSLVDPAKDAVSGAWKLESGRLQSPPSGPALLELPWIPGPDYDLGLSFVASQGAGELAVSLPSASGPLLWLGRVPSGGDEQRAEFRVRGNRVEVTLRGTNFERRETYVGSPASDAKWVFRNPRAVGLGASGGGVEFRRAEILGQGARSRS